MFNFEGTDYKSKSVVAKQMLEAGKTRMEISKSLDISYQTVHALMKKSGLKTAPKADKQTITENMFRYFTETTPVTPVVDEVGTSDSPTV